MRRTKIDGSEGCQTEVQHRLVAGRQSQTLAAKVEQFFNSKGNLTLGSHIYLSVSRNVYIKMEIFIFFPDLSFAFKPCRACQVSLGPLLISLIRISCTASVISPVFLLLFLMDLCCPSQILGCFVAADLQSVNNSRHPREL